MSEHAFVSPSALDDHRAAISLRLHRAALRMAGRLGQLLAELPGPGQESAGFLTGLADTATAHEPCLPPRPADDPHPIDHLATVLGLTLHELELLLLAGLGEEHEGLTAVLRSLHPAGLPHATTGLAAALAEAGLLSGGPPGPPRVWLRMALTSGALALCGVVTTGPGPFWDRTLTLADGLWEAMHGAPGWPEGVIEVDPAVVRATPSALRADEPSVQAALLAIRRGVPATVLLDGDDPVGAAMRFAALAAGTGAVPAVLSARTLTRRLAGTVAVAALARDVVPVFVAADLPDGTELFDELPAPVVLAAPPDAPFAAGERPLLAVTVEPLTARQRAEVWHRLLPDLTEPADVTPRALGPYEAAAAARDAVLGALLRGRSAGPRDVRAAVAARTRDTAPGGVIRVRPSAGWHDLVLPGDRLRQLRDAVVRVARQDVVLDRWGFLPGRPGRRGVRLLFHGPPGTGKTLAAEVLAREINRDLLVVDLSQLVSKWIGETEKNLAAAFDAAERGDAVLFFDEADALFGRRTEVGDSRDRYANLETAYLLSRLALFEGVAVLATNLRQNIDPAFARRLEFVVPFDVPDEQERLSLWRRHLPPDAPLADDIDLAQFAALYPVVGALIRNAAVAAAYLAAAEGSQIVAAHLVQAMRREYTKAGQAFPGPPPEPRTAKESSCP